MPLSVVAADQFAPGLRLIRCLSINQREAMMIVLVGYTSIEGQTKKIAETIATTIETAGDSVLLFNIASMEEYAIGHPEAAILC
eukprot:gene67234-92098_t